MKEQLVEVMNKIKEDVTFHVYDFLDNGQHRCTIELKSIVSDLLENVDEVTVHPYISDVVMIGEKGVSFRDFNKNIYYETSNTDGFLEYQSKYNKYDRVFIKLDKEKKTITFKLGVKEKTLELIEHTEWVHKIYKRKYMKITTVDKLEDHINDTFWNPIMIEVGKEVLGIKEIKLIS